MALSTSTPRSRRRAICQGAGLGAILLAGSLYYMVSMPGRSPTGPFPPLSEPEGATVARMREHVAALAGEVGERNSVFPEALEAAGDYIERVLEAQGYEVRRLPFTVRGARFENIEARLSGSGDAGCLIVAAHYDTAQGTPGADDNASGCAVLLELARRLRERPLEREVRLVFFANEEPPFFQTESMGSVVYAGALESEEPGERVEAMLSLESVGYYLDGPASQRYPFPFSLFYPDIGNFVAVAGNLGSRSLTRRVVGALREHAQLASEGIAAPSWIPGIGWSDHWSFWQHGIPAVMLTDTAPFRNPNYHRPTDTIETLDFERMARLVHGLVPVIVELDRR